MGIHLRVLSESYLMNTKMAGFRWLSKSLCILVLWTKVAFLLEGLSINGLKIRIFQAVLGTIQALMG